MVYCRQKYSYKIQASFDFRNSFPPLPRKYISRSIVGKKIRRVDVKRVGYYRYFYFLINRESYKHFTIHIPATKSKPNNPFKHPNTTIKLEPFNKSNRRTKNYCTEPPLTASCNNDLLKTIVASLSVLLARVFCVSVGA